MKKIKVLFVCLGNICRSPTAEGVFKRCVAEAGLDHLIESDSAGTGDYHIGDPPDARACAAAERRGYDLSKLRGRQVSRKDFAEFDHILAMDEQNLRDLKRLAPRDQQHKVKLFTEYCSSGACAVPDPYGGGAQEFERVLDLVEDSAKGLLEHLRQELRA